MQARTVRGNIISVKSVTYILKKCSLSIIVAVYYFQNRHYYYYLKYENGGSRIKKNG